MLSYVTAWTALIPLHLDTKYPEPHLRATVLIIDVPSGSRLPVQEQPATYQAASANAFLLSAFIVSSLFLTE